MEFDIAVLPGDGIGPEVVAEATKVLQAIGEKFGHAFHLHQDLIGGAAIDAFGKALKKETFDMCRECDAILFGAVGGPKWDDVQGKACANEGLFHLRKEFGLFANLRPVKVLPALINSTSLKPEIIEGVDLVIIRELIGGLYFGQPKKQWRTPEGRKVVDTLSYSETEIERVLRVGFELARTRSGNLTSVDKSNVLHSSSLWRQIAIEISDEYPDVELRHLYVDACAMRLMRDPVNFDVLVMENTFGDILSDEASVLAGSMGMLPSASLSGMPKGRTFGLYEPVHGSDPERAGQNLDNPIATILSAAMMLHYSMDLPAETRAIEDAIVRVLEEGYRTYDIMERGKIEVGTIEMGDLIVQNIRSS
ncbi:MAG: 3-isopropylmalate dehydrogenase [Deltaproteobacteria bacterium]|nr:3-isopropylmalate dehydrogenase [Deltaproteobacteria bacterium]